MDLSVRPRPADTSRLGRGRSHRRRAALPALLLLAAATLLGGAHAQWAPGVTQEGSAVTDGTVTGITGTGITGTGITVTGTGVAYGEPDQAVLTLGVSVADEAVRPALTNADARMAAVKQALVTRGVSADDVRTLSFNVWRQDVFDDAGTVAGERYHVEHQYEVVVRDVDAVSELLAAAVDAGANSVGGVSFTISNPDELRAAAREAAVRDAVARAEHLARLTGVRLLTPDRVTEGPVTTGGARYDVRYAAEGLGGGVSAGQLSVQVDVTITFATATLGSE